MKNIFDLDRLKEILDTLTRNRSRTILTGFGIFWGVFMLLAMSGGGKGLKTILTETFDGFAQNSVIIGPSTTTKASKPTMTPRSWNPFMRNMVTGTRSRFTLVRNMSCKFAFVCISSAPFFFVQSEEIVGIFLRSGLYRKPSVVRISVEI